MKKRFNEGGGVSGYTLFSVKVFIQRAYRRELTRLCALSVGSELRVVGFAVKRNVFREALYVRSIDRFDMLYRYITHRS